MKYIHIGRIKMRLEYKPEDMWVGLYWKNAELSTDIWVCILPTLPIHIVLWKQGLSVIELGALQMTIIILSLLILLRSCTNIVQAECAPYADCDPYLTYIPLVTSQYCCTPPPGLLICRPWWEQSEVCR